MATDSSGTHTSCVQGAFMVLAFTPQHAAERSEANDYGNSSRHRNTIGIMQPNFYRNSGQNCHVSDFAASLCMGSLA